MFESGSESWRGSKRICQSLLFLSVSHTHTHTQQQPHAQPCKYEELLKLKGVVLTAYDNITCLCFVGLSLHNKLNSLYQLVHKFFYFAHLKSIFSILHTYFYKTLTSICLFYTFIQIKYSFLYPHSHRPTPTIYTGITPESTQPTDRKQEKQTQQNGSKPTPESTPHLEQQDQRLQRQVMAMARDIQPHSTRNPLIKPIQLENTEKQRKKEQSAAATMAIDGS